MKYALWLYSAPGLTGTSCRRLWEQGLTAQQIYGMDERALRGISGMKASDADAILRHREARSPQECLLALEEQGIGFVSIEQKEYPRRLGAIGNPPYGLYYKGRLPAEGHAAAIVGARERSEYGRTMARRLGEALAREGVAVISGMARGIDADGHKGALDGGGSTYAVLGCGVDICYPRSNQYLYDRILSSGGGILSEYHPGQAPLPRLFPSRNRLISGLSECVAVIEAREKSGSLITADFAMEQGRDVYALPGRVTDPLSGGCNELIRQGAGILTDTENFVRELQGWRKNSCVQLDFRKIILEKDEKLVYSLLDFCPKGIGTILEQAGMSLEELLDVLGRLEEREFVREAIPNFYVRSS